MMDEKNKLECWPKLFRVHLIVVAMIEGLSNKKTLQYVIIKLALKNILRTNSLSNSGSL